jgi:hypothetical protein
VTKTGVEHFAIDLKRMMRHYIHEYEMTYAEMIGVLVMEAVTLAVDDPPPETDDKKEPSDG